VPSLWRHVRGQPPDERGLRARLLPTGPRRHGQAPLHRRGRPRRRRRRPGRPVPVRWRLLWRRLRLLTRRPRADDAQPHGRECTRCRADGAASRAAAAAVPAACGAGQRRGSLVGGCARCWLRAVLAPCGAGRRCSVACRGCVRCRVRAVPGACGAAWVRSACAASGERRCLGGQCDQRRVGGRGAVPASATWARWAMRASAACVRAPRPCLSVRAAARPGWWAGGVLTVMGMWCAAATKAGPGDLRRPERVVLGLRAGIWCPAVDLRDGILSRSGVTVRRGERPGALTPAGTSERSAGTGRVRRVLARSISLRHA
jgi:hypothetical protein